MRVLRLRPDTFGKEAPLTAVTLTALVYFHHVTVRSDAPHLGQCIQPLLLVLFGLGALLRPAWARLGVDLALVLLSVLAALESHTSLRWIAPWRTPGPRFEVDVAGDTMRLMGGQRNVVEGLRRAVGDRLAPEDEIFIAPSRPTYYPLLRKRAPVPEIYLFWFAPEEDQRALVQRLEERRVRWVLLVDTAVDQREDLRFSSTHPLVWEHVRQRYERVPTPGLRPDHLLFRLRDA